MRLQKMAISNYGVNLSEYDARVFRDKLITEIYPELNNQTGYLADELPDWFAESLGLTRSQLLYLLKDATDPSGKWNCREAILLLNGQSKLTDLEQSRIWGLLGNLNKELSKPNDVLNQLVTLQKPDEKISRVLLNQKSATLTGRIRSNVDFTAAKNNPFQSLAADGAKLALWNLMYEGFDIYAFVHDEIVVNVPKVKAQESAAKMVSIMERSMEDLLLGIPAKCEWTVADHWGKP